MLNLKDDGLFQTTLRSELRAAYLPPTELAELQLRRLRTLLERAAHHVPLYRALYAGHLDALHSLTGPDALWQLPAVSKEDFLRVGPEGYVDERQDLSRLARVTTSGSLGRTLELFATPTEGTIHAALHWAAWMGQVTAEDRLFCLAAPSLQFSHQFVANRFIPVEMGDVATRRQFEEFQPTVVIGSVEAIALLARDLRQHETAGRRRVRLVFPFGQTLTPALESMIREGFDAAIFNLYGADETLWLGVECEYHDGLHLPAGRAVVQIARLNQPDQSAGPGELGEVIVTSLARWTTPFIRYRLGDVAMLDTAPCPCGRATPRIRSLEGRVQDFLISATGAWISPGALETDLAFGQDNLLDHRIVQEALDRVRVWIVPGPAFAAPDRLRITDVIRRHLGPVHVDTELTREIPRDPSGKRRRVYREFALPNEKQGAP